MERRLQTWFNPRIQIEPCVFWLVTWGPLLNAVSSFWGRDSNATLNGFCKAKVKTLALCLGHTQCSVKVTLCGLNVSQIRNHCPADWSWTLSMRSKAPSFTSFTHLLKLQLGQVQVVRNKTTAIGKLIILENWKLLNNTAYCTRYMHI